VRARAPLLALPLAAAVLLPGCGNERATVPEVEQPDRPAAYETYTSPGGEVSFSRPTNWGVFPGTAPEVARMYSGRALVTIYAYPRTDLPDDAAGVLASRRRLLASLRRRAPELRIVRSRITEVDGAPAVELGATGRIGRRAVVEHTVHVYKPGAEYVIDAYAAPAAFRLAERWGFGPLMESISLAANPRL
jgi:hypothetical protein